MESVRRCQKELVAQLMALVQSGLKANTSGEGTNVSSPTTATAQSSNAKSSVNSHSILSQCGPVCYTGSNQIFSRRGNVGVHGALCRM